MQDIDFTILHVFFITDNDKAAELLLLGLEKDVVFIVKANCT